MTLTRRLLLPLVAASIALPAFVVPGALGAQGTPGASPSPASASSTGPTGATGDTVPPATLSASLTACHSDPLAANRYAIFASQMVSVPRTATMAVNFQLEERSASTPRFAPVSAPGFGVWVSSQPGVGIFTYNHEVTALPAPAAFRVLIRARWLDRRRHVLRRGELVSPVCPQPLLTPNLAIGTITRAPGTPAGMVSYNVEVRNDGSAAAGPFQVALSVGGVALANVSVASLAAGAKQVVQFSGPRCAAGSTISATADPAGAVSEPANPNRTKVFPCIR